MSEKRFVLVSKGYSPGTFTHSKFYARRGDASRGMKPGDWIEEYDLVKVKEWVKFGKDYVERTEEVKLLYE